MLFPANKTEVNNFWVIVMLKSAYRYFWQVSGFASRQGTKKYKGEWKKEEEKQRKSKKSCWLSLILIQKKQFTRSNMEL